MVEVAAEAAVESEEVRQEQGRRRRRHGIECLSTRGKSTVIDEMKVKSVAVSSTSSLDLMSSSG